MRYNKPYQARVQGDFNFYVVEGWSPQSAATDYIDRYKPEWLESDEVRDLVITVFDDTGETRLGNYRVLVDSDGYEVVGL